MIKALLFDFSRTLLFPHDKTYIGGLNDLYKKLSTNSDFNFLETFELNGELIDYIEAVKDKLPSYIFTSESIQDDPAIIDKLNSTFTKIFSAKKMGISKKDPRAYEFIAKELNFNPNEILFIDDSLENIEVAINAGLETMHYKDNSIINVLKNLFKSQRNWE